MYTDETVKLMAKTIQESLTKFVGQKMTQGTENEVRSHMVGVLNSMKSISGLHSPLPRIETSVDSDRREITFSFFDPKTNEQISVSTWLARASEGFYV